ncbi:MAG: MFS transporter [Planctomycetota bacterium]|nr:MAG: MFS transporter [Planctomycetota bacterium]
MPNALENRQSKGGGNATPAPWAPFGIASYRSFWVAGFISNLGTWMHETGAQWLMASLAPQPHMVAAVRTCMAVPFFFLALPAGVWADNTDRRMWLQATQVLLFLTAASMAVLAAAGWMTPSMLLALTSIMGIAMVLNQPAWQSLTPELVPPAMVPTAVSVGSLSFNLARALGPALAGILIAQFDVWVAFALNAFSFLVVLRAVRGWRLAAAPPKKVRPRFWAEMRGGLQVVQRVTEVRHAIARLFVFALPASVLWSLLALVAKQKLHFEERGFGLCLAFLGSGAVIGAWFISYVRARLSSECIVLVAQVTFGLLCVVIGLQDTRQAVLPALLVMGCCWMATMTTLNATAQVFLPRAFRARGMASYLMAFSLGTSLGSALWGWYARATSVDAAYWTAGAALIAAAAAAHRLSLGDLRNPSPGEAAVG